MSPPSGVRGITLVWNCVRFNLLQQVILQFREFIGDIGDFRQKRFHLIICARTEVGYLKTHTLTHAHTAAAPLAPPPRSARSRLAPAFAPHAEGGYFPFYFGTTARSKPFSTVRVLEFFARPTR